MHAIDWFRFLVGHREAIQTVAKSSSAIWTGIVLVCLTAIARNYDQTFILEKPVLWLFGPLLFSLVSGTWLYAIVYGGFARKVEAVSSAWARWRSFMGLFWMTAPIAWLYAIPVERFLDSYPATKVNLCLLGVVSIWRVILMARVVQVTTAARFAMALVWVLFAAAVEVLVVFFFGGVFAEAIMRGMGGMRNSPEEDLIFGVMSTVFVIALWAAPAFLLVGVFWRPKHALTPLPPVETTSLERIPLIVPTLAWIAVAIVPQRELANNVAVENLIAAGQPRLALDYLSARHPDEFSPGRVLAPNAFERSVFKEVPAFFSVIRADDAEWVRAHLIRRLHEMTTHYGPPRRSRRWDPARTPQEQIQDAVVGLRRRGPEPDELTMLIAGLNRIPEGRVWLSTNTSFLTAVWRNATEIVPKREEQRGDWLILSNFLHQSFATNGISLPAQIRPDPNP